MATIKKRLEVVETVLQGVLGGVLSGLLAVALKPESRASKTGKSTHSDGKVVIRTSKTNNYPHDGKLTFGKIRNLEASYRRKNVATGSLLPLGDIVVATEAGNKAEMIKAAGETNRRFLQVSEQARIILKEIWFEDRNGTGKSFEKVNIMVAEANSALSVFMKWLFDNDFLELVDQEKFDLFTYRMNFMLEATMAIKEQRQISDEVYEKLSFSDKVMTFALLEDNWDDYGAKSVSKTAIKNALRFMSKYKVFNPCFVHATIDGKVGIDYKYESKRLETKVSSRDVIVCRILEDKKKIVLNKAVEQDNFVSIYKLILK